MERFHFTMSMVLLVLAVLLALPLASCSKDEENTLSNDEQTEQVQEEDSGSQVPAGLIGTWTGVGTTEYGDSNIDLTMTINPDGTGDYEFDQLGYHETCPFNISWDDNTFSVEVPDGSPIENVSGTWKLEDGSLILDITSVLPSGNTYSYTAICSPAGEG